MKWASLRNSMDKTLLMNEEAAFDREVDETYHLVSVLEDCLTCGTEKNMMRRTKVSVRTSNCRGDQANHVYGKSAGHNAQCNLICMIAEKKATWKC